MDENECEVYSWFPEREYDPHLDPDDDEYSDEEIEEDPIIDEDRGDDMDLDDPSWGQAGMELDDVPGSLSARRRASGSKMSPVSPTFGPDTSFSSNDGYEKRRARLLWSQNYFFYSR